MERLTSAELRGLEAEADYHDQAQREQTDAEYYIGRIDDLVGRVDALQRQVDTLAEVVYRLEGR